MFRQLSSPAFSLACRKLRQRTFNVSGGSNDRHAAVCDDDVVGCQSTGVSFVAQRVSGTLGFHRATPLSVARLHDRFVIRNVATFYRDYAVGRQMGAADSVAGHQRVGDDAVIHMADVDEFVRGAAVQIEFGSISWRIAGVSVVQKQG